MNPRHIHALTGLIKSIAALIRETSLAIVLILHAAPASEPPISPPAPRDSSPRTNCESSVAGYRCA